MRRQILAACALAVAMVATLAVVHLVTAGLARTSLSAPAQQAPPAPAEPRERPWGPTTPAIDAQAAARRPGEQLFAELPPAPAQPAPPYAPNELIVRFKPGVSANERKALHDSQAATEGQHVDEIDAFKVSLPQGSDVEAAAQAYEGDPRVEFAQPSYRYTTFGGPPTDPAYVDIQHWYYHAINAPAGWQIETGDPGIIVAVVDTGVDITHPDVDDQIWTNPGEIAGNAIDDDGNGCVDDVHGCAFAFGTSSGNPADDIGHGTFVGGVACGEANNGVSGVGVSFDCTIMPVKVLTFGGGDSPDIAAGIVYAAENGADVINMSLGSGCVPGTPPSDPVIQAAMDVAHDIYGVTIVASAGNSDEGCVSLPAADPNAIAVSASGYLDDADGKAGFSQWGPEISVTAPGVDIVSALPPQFCGIIGDCLDDGRTAISSGTSFSAPQVSGLAALLLAQDGTRTNEDVRTIMQNTAHDLPDGDTPNWDGAGRIDVTAALGGDSVFAPVLIGHAFPPVLQLTVGAGNPGSPSCQAVILDAPPILASRISGTFGVSECAAAWPPSVATPWFLKGIDSDLFPDDGAIFDFALESGGLLCSAFDTPVAIPDDDPDGGASIIECPPVPELVIRLSPPAQVAVGDQFDYELEVKNRGAVAAAPVVVQDDLPPEVALAGSPPAGCSAVAGTVTCDVGTLASGQTAVVALTVDTMAPGLITNCATVDPANQVAEGNEDNNTFCADTAAIQIPPPAFSNADPAGDSFGSVPPDIIDVRGSFDADEFFLTLEFANSIGLGDVAGYIDFDTDQNPLTGYPSNADFNCFTAPNLPPGMEGSDVFGDLFSGTHLFLHSTTFGSVGAVPILYGDDTMTMIIPLTMLSGDNALDFTMVLGTGFQATDCAPNGTSLTCSAGDCDKLPPPPPPPNDNFVDRIAVPEPLSPPVRLSENARLATVEVDEPQPCGALENTIWYSFTPTRDTIVLAEGANSEFGIVGIAAYTGGTLPALQSVACATGQSEFEFRAQGHVPETLPRIAFTAVAGVTYQFQLGSVPSIFEEGRVGELILTLQGAPAPPCAPGGTPGDNNGFEAGIANTKLISCWTSLDQPGGTGGWCIQTGGQAPSGDCTRFSFSFAAPPPEGVHAAMTNSSGPGTHLLYRCGVLDVGTIMFRLFLNNEGGAFAPALSLDYRRFPNQQFRADLVSPAGMTADAFTLRPEHILANLYQTDAGDPNPPGYALAVANASAFVGQNVCLRFAEVNGFAPLIVGIDDVRFVTRKDPLGDSDRDGIPNGTDPDDDNDGCTDVREGGANALQGGQRSSHSLWDFFDVPTGASLQRDRAVTAADLAGIVARFGASDFDTGAFDRGSDPFSTPNPAIQPSGSRANYHPAFDRGGSMPGQQAWDLLPANGSITASDLAAVAAQFGHTCA